MSGDAGDLAVSFEFSPPRTLELELKLWQVIQRLAPLRPHFVSVTYGAGGSTRERTHATVRRIREETALEPAAHLTCVGAARAEIDAIARDYWDAGIRHLVALRGDPPGGLTEAYVPHPEGYAYAVDLVAGIRRIADFELSVAAYPETHPAAVSPEADLANLKAKIDAGAGRAITQFFFERDVFLRFLDRARGAGITVPIVPGIMPVGNPAQVAKFASACGASMPARIARAFDGCGQDVEQRKKIAIDLATSLCQSLRDEGVREFHFYTMNRADLTTGICRNLGITAPVAR